MFDLLATQPFLERADGMPQMAIGEDENGVYVKGLSSHLAQTEEEALNLLFEVRMMIFSHKISEESKSHFFQLNMTVFFLMLTGGDESCYCTALSKCSVVALSLHLHGEC